MLFYRNLFRKVTVGAGQRMAVSQARHRGGHRGAPRQPHPHQQPGWGKGDARGGGAPGLGHHGGGPRVHAGEHARPVIQSRTPTISKQYDVMVAPKKLRQKKDDVKSKCAKFGRGKALLLESDMFCS